MRFRGHYFPSQFPDPSSIMFSHELGQGAWFHTANETVRQKCCSLPHPALWADHLRAFEIPEADKHLRSSKTINHSDSNKWGARAGGAPLHARWLSESHSVSWVFHSQRDLLEVLGERQLISINMTGELCSQFLVSIMKNLRQADL